MQTILKINIPEDIKRKFKSLCAAEGMSMRDKLVQLMIAEIDKSK
jgi:hypothetical protein